MFQELVRLVSGDGKRTVAVIEAYLDESGAHKSARAMTVAGYWGPSEAWNEFTKQWRTELGRAGVEIFHAKDQRCDHLRAPLADLIDATGIHGVFASIRREDYGALVGDRVLSVFGNAYAVGVWYCALRILDRTGDEPVSFVVESGQPNSSFIADKLEFLMDDLFRSKALGFGWNVASVTVARKSEFVPLQTADFLAHATNANDQAWLARLQSAERINEARIPDARDWETWQLFLEHTAKNKRRARNARRRERKLK